MTTIRIVGGGLMGVLAALEAHRLGCREIELHERLEGLGGALRAGQSHGLELRDRYVAFGGARDPVRRVLDWHGFSFDEFEPLLGSVSPGPGAEPVYMSGFDGPALASAGTALVAPGGDSLADRFRAYPAEVEQALSRYCQWRVGVWLDELHSTAAASLGVGQVFPSRADISFLAELKRSERLYDELYALPPAFGGRSPTAAVPSNGFVEFFNQARRRLHELGVKVHEPSLVSPREILHRRDQGEVVVWAADPTALFRPLDVRAPKLIRHTVPTYVFKIRQSERIPTLINSFTADGAVFRTHAYASRGEALLCAECVRETGEVELRREIRGMTAAFGAEADALGELVGASVRSRRIPSVDAVRQQETLRCRLAETFGASFVPAGWEGSSLAEKFTALSAALSAAVEAPASAGAIPSARSAA